MSCLRNGKQRDSCFVQNKEKIFIPTNVSFHKSSGRMCVWDRAGGVIPAPKICLLVMGKLLEGRGSVPLSGLFTNQSAVDSLWMKKLSSLPTDVTHEWTPPPPPPPPVKARVSCGTPSWRSGRRSYHRPPCSLTVRALGQTWVLAEFYHWTLPSLGGI